MTDTWLVYAGALLLLGLWVLGVHNRITALKAAVLAAWAGVDAVLQDRGHAVAALLREARAPLASEAAALDAVDGAQAQLLAAAEAVRRSPVAADTVADLSKADAVLAAVLVRLQALLEQQPALQADARVAAALKTLHTVPLQMAFARQVFNDAGAAYNAAVQQFPTRLLGALLQFGRAGRL